MTRVRTNNVFGTTTDNPLTAGATTMNSAGLANLAAVSSAEAIIVLDPNRVSGAPEIVVVTAHTGSATSATIQRGQFGTSAREHAQGTEWVHGPITTNATSYATAADDQGDFVPMNAWETWTPTWVNLTVGSGTLVSRFTRVGRTIHFYLSFTLGAGSAISGDVTFTLPVAANNPVFTPLGRVEFQDTGAANVFGTSWIQTSTTGRIFVDLASGTYVGLQTLSSTVPFTWVSTDRFSLQGTYEAAS